MLKQKVHLVLAILLTFGIQCYCSTTAAGSQTLEQSSTTTVTPHESGSTNKESTTNGNTASGSEHTSTTTNAKVVSTNQSAVSITTENVSTKVTSDFIPSLEGSYSSSIASTNSSFTTSGAVTDVNTDGINASSTNAAPSTFNSKSTGGPTTTGPEPSTNQSTTTKTTTTKTTTKTTTGTTKNINGPSKNKGEPMSLEEKQRRNGIVSASICVGSLVLIGIAYLSSFVDKPSEKVPKFPKNKYNKEETNYKSQTKPAGTKKISFDNGFSFQETPTTSSHQPNLKSPVKTDQIESPIKTDQIELNSVENNDKNIQNENRRRTGWDVLSKDPAYFDNYQPKHTTTQAEVNEL
ncbi:mucin-21-like [Mytilus trossulus]|uniref:mucin-21-like n=1 Tax=Mytilus trossulus TaxID=6551 RepID=UPI003004FEBB